MGFLLFIFFAALLIGGIGLLKAATWALVVAGILLLLGAGIGASIHRRSRA